MTVFPVTASTISAKALCKFAIEKYNLSENFTCKLFRTGINHTYFLSSDEKKCALRVYSYNWRTKQEIEQEIELLNLLKDNNLSVSFPIKDKEGKFIQTINAPEGNRYVVVFSFAEGEKVRFMNHDTCFSIGSLMAKIHKTTLNKTTERIIYQKNTLIDLPYQYLKEYFSEKLPEMEYLKELGKTFKNSDFEIAKKGIVHLDIWYDNMAVSNANKITIFDFDFCGNGSQILDVAYFCKQLFFIETNKDTYQSKMQSFLDGYQKTNPLSEKELQLIPIAGASIFIFYLGVQAQRFDWSNIFLSENYLKMFVGRIQSWIHYHDSKETLSSKN